MTFTEVIGRLVRGRVWDDGVTVYCEIGHFTRRTLVRVRRVGSSLASTA